MNNSREHVKRLLIEINEIMELTGNKILAFFEERNLTRADLEKLNKEDLEKLMEIIMVIEPIVRMVDNNSENALEIIDFGDDIMKELILRSDCANCSNCGCKEEVGKWKIN